MHHAKMHHTNMHHAYTLHMKMHPTPRIGLFVRPSVTKKPRIIDTCIRVKDHGYASFIPASYTHASGSRIIYIYASWIPAYMHQGQGSRIIDISIIIRLKDHRYICIIHTCISPTYIRFKDQRYVHHTHMHQDQGS